MYSNTNHYLKLSDSDELLTEVMTLGKEPIDVIETDTLIQATPPSELQPWEESLQALDVLLGVNNE